MKKLLFLLFTLCLLWNAHASAQDTVKRLCVRAANQTYRDSLAEARRDLNLDQATCRFGTTVGACISTCYTDLKTCVQPAAESIQDCRRSCALTLDAARDAAKTQLGCGENCGTSSEYQKIVYRARIAFYSCQNTCRLDDAAVAARAACRTVYAACTKSCRG